MTIRQFFLIACVFTPALLSAQIDNPKAIFRELRGLDGTWFMPTDRGDRLEVWHIVDDSSMTGRGLRIRPENGDTITLETMRLERRDTNIFYTVIVRGQNQNQPVTFKMTQADWDGYLFENPEHDDPKKIRYLLLGNRELQVTTEGRRGNRDTKQEYVFEREFTPAGMEFRLRAGGNLFTQHATGNFNLSNGQSSPEYSPKPGWELGTQFSFRGRGGFVSLNFELGFIGKYSHAKADFVVIDTAFTEYRRDVTYGQTWLVLAAVPEITLKRDGKLSFIVGPYLGRLLFTGTNGTVLPTDEDNKLFKANNDFKKTDVGVLAGFQYKLNFGKKDIGGRLGLRANLGFSNLDNLYTTRGDGDPAFYNGRVGLRGVSLYYSFDLLKL